MSDDQTPPVPPDASPEIASTGLGAGTASIVPRKAPLQKPPLARPSVEALPPTDRTHAARPPKDVVYEETGLRSIIPARWKLYTGGGLLVVALILWWGFQPIRGTIHVGICRTLIQTQVKYPASIRTTAVEWFKNTLRIYFTHIDAFGEDRSEVFECEFNPDLTLRDARMNRISLAADKVEAFNRSIPAVIASKPDVIIPSGPTDDLRSLKTD